MVKTNDTGLRFIKKHEGCRLKAYLCASGVATIGYGNTFYQDGTPVKLGDVITQKQADELFLLIIKQFETAVDKMLKVPLTPNQYAAVISLTYNIGTGNFGRSTFLKLLNAGKYIEAAEAFGKHVYSRGKVLAGLVKRRVEEKALFLS